MGLRMSLQCVGALRYSLWMLFRVSVLAVVHRNVFIETDSRVSSAHMYAVPLRRCSAFESPLGQPRIGSDTPRTSRNRPRFVSLSDHRGVSRGWNPPSRPEGCRTFSPCHCFVMNWELYQIKVIVIFPKITAMICYCSADFVTITLCGVIHIWSWWLAAIGKLQSQGLNEYFTWVSCFK